MISVRRTVLIVLSAWHGLAAIKNLCDLGASFGVVPAAGAPLVIDLRRIPTSARQSVRLSFSDADDNPVLFEKVETLKRTSNPVGVPPSRRWMIFIKSAAAVIMGSMSALFTTSA